MLETDEKNKAIDALNNFDERTLKKIIREHIQEISQGMHAKYPDDLATYIIDKCGEELLCDKNVRKIMVEGLYDKSDRTRVEKLLCALGKEMPLSTKMESLVEEACIGRWISGGGMSRRFVRFFGFPDIFAGERFLHPKYSNPEEITAWKRVPEMHPYQTDLKDMIETTTLDKSNGRCMFTLPTGAGKTRVVVEVLTGYIKNRIMEDEDGIYKGVILWVAHSEELCAQAIDAMKWVWQTHGEGEEPLRVYRHWGEYEIEGDAYLSGIIVASIQKIESTLKSNPGLLVNLKDRFDFIVIDEAHKSIAPTYKRMIKEFGQNTRIIGLTATPFRANDDETKKLASLYNNNLIELRNDPTPFDWLRNNGFLCKQIKKECLESEMTLEPNEDDLSFRDQFNEVSKRLLRELAEDEVRNEKIVSRIVQLIKDNEKVLLFTCSVNHCSTIRDLLGSKGIQSAVITGDTGKGRRWRHINDFKKGDIRVLINYGVLSTGFDDPKIDVIFIARPTMSSVLYGQMIGRGLRGPKNGGTDSCRIIDVIDNILNFDILNSDIYLDAWSQSHN